MRGEQGTLNLRISAIRDVSELCPLWVLQIVGSSFAGILNMLLWKTKEVVKLLPGNWRFEKQDLVPTFVPIPARSVGLCFSPSLALSPPPSPSKPSIPEWDWLGCAHPHGSISNSSCTGYQILCLLVPGSKSSADL